MTLAATLTPLLQVLTTRRTLALFFAIAYAWAWLVFVPVVVLRAPLQWIVAASFGPTVAALITHRVTTGSWRAFRAFTTWRRTLGATAAGIALIVLAYVVLPGVLTADPRRLH